MAKIRVGKPSNVRNIGIHLFDPTKKQIDDAKEDAANKDFPFVYIHKTRVVTVHRKRS